MPHSCDALLGGRVQILQPAEAYRAGLDAVFLAAACAIRSQQSLLDVGCGVGSVFLCIAARVPNIDIHGIEADHVYAELARKNSALNERAANICTYTLPGQGDPFAGRKFDHVVSNPPYHEKHHHDPSPSPLRAKALGEINVRIDEWLDYCLRKTSDRGYLTLIYPITRLDDVIAALHKRVGDIHIYPLWSYENVCKRVIISARKNAKGGTVIHRGMIVHNSDGHYTEAAQAILREGKALSFQPE